MVGRFARRLRDQEDQTLPLPAGPVSNGEFVPASPDSRALATNELIRSVVDDTAKRLGSTAAAFCRAPGPWPHRWRHSSWPGARDLRLQHDHRRTTNRGRGGTYLTPSPLDTAGCQQALMSKGEFIVDAHTHHVIPAGPWTQNAPETVGLILGMLARRLRRQSPAGLCGPGHLPPRHVPGQRHRRWRS